MGMERKVSFTWSLDGKKTFRKFWLVNRDPYNGSLQSLYKWVDWLVATQIFFGIFTPKIGEDEPILTSIFFTWGGETTN